MYNWHALILSAFYFLLRYRNELKAIILETESELDSIRHNEISLDVNNEAKDDVVSIDIREQALDAIAALKKSVGLITLEWPI